MTIPRNLSILAEGASSSGVLGAAYGGTGLSSVGTLGNVLTSNGSAWISSTPSAGAATQGGFQSSATSLYISFAAGFVNNLSTPTASRIYYSAFVVGSTTTFTKIGTYLASNAGAGSFFRIGLYNWANGKATTRILDSGAIEQLSTGIYEVSISQTLSPGVYSFAIISDSASCSFKGANISAPMNSFQYGVNDFTSNPNTACLYESGTGNTLPSTATTTPSNLLAVSYPLVYMRV